MIKDLTQKPLKDDHAVTSVAVLAAHITWLFLGPIILIVILYGVLNAGARWLDPLDALFFAVVGLIFFTRWIDQKSGQSTDSEGNPSTWEDFRHFVLTLPAYAGAAWLVAKLLGHYFF
jgi:hypothetical protein